MTNTTGDPDSSQEKLSESQLAFLKQYLAVASKDIELKAKQTDIRTLEIQSTDKQVELGYKNANRELELTAEDLKDSRKDKQETLTKLFIFSGLMILLLCGLLGFAIYLSKDEIAKEIIKYIGYLASVGIGGAGGYAYGFNKGKDSISDDSDD